MPVQEIGIVFSFFRFFGLLRAKIWLGSAYPQIYFLIYEPVNVEKQILRFDFQPDKIKDKFYFIFNNN